MGNWLKLVGCDFCGWLLSFSRRVAFPRWGDTVDDDKVTDPRVVGLLGYPSFI